MELGRLGCVRAGVKRRVEQYAARCCSWSFGYGIGPRGIGRVAAAGEWRSLDAIVSVEDAVEEWVYLLPGSRGVRN